MYMVVVFLVWWWCFCGDVLGGGVHGVWYGMRLFSMVIWYSNMHNPTHPSPPHTPPGVPLKHTIAGVAMGLILEPNGNFAVLTDILGSEDALGDMDFKVAGSADAVTAFQMDIKVEGITLEIMRVALERAKVARCHILGEMGKANPPAKRALSPYVPRIVTVMIDPSKVCVCVFWGGLYGVRVYVCVCVRVYVCVCLCVWVWVYFMCMYVFSSSSAAAAYHYHHHHHHHHHHHQHQQHTTTIHTDWCCYWSRWKGDQGHPGKDRGGNIM